WNADGRVACGGRNGRITIWEQTGKLIQQIALSDEVSELVFAGDGANLVAGDSAGHFGVYQIEGGKLASHLELPLAPKSVLNPAIASTLRPTTPPPTQSISDKFKQSPIWAQVSAAEAEARHATTELASMREASASADAAMKLSEQSLAKLRDSAA